MTASALREWRTAQGLSRRELAEALGVPATTIRDWEQGWRGVPHGRLLDLALAALAAEATAYGNEFWLLNEADNDRIAPYPVDLNIGRMPRQSTEERAALDSIF